MTYTFTYRKPDSRKWNSEEVTGHKYDNTADHMDLFYQDGTIFSIGDWKRCDLKLGKDWIMFTKAMMEEETGQSIKLKKEVI